GAARLHRGGHPGTGGRRQAGAARLLGDRPVRPRAGGPGGGPPRGPAGHAPAHVPAGRGRPPARGALVVGPVGVQGTAGDVAAAAAVGAAGVVAGALVAAVVAAVVAVQVEGGAAPVAAAAPEAQGGGVGGDAVGQGARPEAVVVDGDVADAGRVGQPYPPGARLVGPAHAGTFSAP